MQSYGVNWYNPITENTLRRAMPGEVLSLSLWTGRVPDSWYAIRVNTEPQNRTTWHRNVDSSIFGRNEWLEFQIVFGELVYNHAKGFFPVPAPMWEVYPEGIKARPAQPAAVAYRFETTRNPVAHVWWGEPGQDPEEFRKEVLAMLPQPLTIEERFAIRKNQSLRVMVAAEPSLERDEMVHHLTAQRGKGVITLMASTTEEVVANLDQFDVIIIADELPQAKGEKLESTTSFINKELGPRKIPRVGWAINVQRRWNAGDRYADLSFIMMHLQAACGRVLGSDSEPSRSVLDHILDALDVAKLREE